MTTEIDREGRASAEATIASTLGASSGATPSRVARGTTLGRYLVVAEIGAGATGRVLSAYDPDLDRRVAIKLLSQPLGSEATRKKLLTEARAMAKIRHANVVAVHDVGVHDDRLYIAMEFVEGVTLGLKQALGER